MDIQDHREVDKNIALGHALVRSGALHALNQGEGKLETTALSNVSLANLATTGWTLRRHWYRNSNDC